jgi:hypothetical protein
VTGNIYTLHAYGSNVSGDGTSVAAADTVVMAEEGGGGGGDMVPAKAVLLYNGSVGSTRDITVSIYDSGNDLLISSETLSAVDSTPETLEFDFTDAPELSSGTYYLAVTVSGALNFYAYHTAESSQARYSTDTTPPDPLPAGTPDNKGKIGLWVVNSSDEMILGHSSDSGDYPTSTTCGSNRTYWVSDGYAVE